MNSLLFSLNGSPVTYYGDEIGMGDNPFLGDRDGVRTPMQWSSDRNAGFSGADYVDLYLPPIEHRFFAYDIVNVAEQRKMRSSLNWCGSSTPAISPALMTIIRSLMEITSGSSDEMSNTPAPPPTSSSISR